MLQQISSFFASRRIGCSTTASGNLRRVAFFAVILGVFSASPEQLRAESPLPKSAKAFLEAHCFDCHTGSDAEAGLDLTSLAATHSGSESRAEENEASPAELMETWARIHDRVRAGEMPPPDAGELDDDEIHGFSSHLGDWIRRTQQAEAAEAGRVRGRRLTNLQLERTLHDLLGIDIPLADGFSDEARVGGFTTVADGQAMSHFQLEQHLNAVDAALDEAFRRAATKPDSFDHKFTPKELAKRRPKQRNREPELREGLAAIWSSRLIFYGRMSVTTAKESGWYRFTIKAEALKPPKDHGVWCSVRTGPCTSSAPLLRTIGGFEATEVPGEWTFEGWLPKGHMLEVRPADRTLGMARFNGGQVGAGEGEDQDVPGVAFHWVRMQRIHQGPDDDAIRKILFADLKVTNEKNRPIVHSSDPRADARPLIEQFARRAFRRPVEASEVAPYVALVRRAIDDDVPFADALRLGYRALLCSPRFLYFQEVPGPLGIVREITVDSPLAPAGRGQGEGVGKTSVISRTMLDDFAVASRLSYFLWNRMPDETLWQLAEAGKLSNPDTVRRQVRRMLDDPRGESFVKDFADQWLDLCDIDFTEPEPNLFRDFDTMVQQSMLEETHRYLQKMLDENLSISHLIDSDFAILNSRLARFYGINGVEGDRMRIVPLKAEDRRGGLITHGSIMKVTANGSTTSPVIRGVWISERLLGEHIPPPPQNVPAIEPDIRGAVTIREQLEKHKSDSGCAVCHVKIDPPGFALENYDPSGKWRDAYVTSGGGKKGRLKVDPSNEMPDGSPFDGIDEFKQLVLRDPANLARGVADKLVMYGTGAAVRFADREAIEQAVEESAADDYGFRSIVEAVAASPLFLSK